VPVAWRAWATDRYTGVDVDAVADKFVAHHRSKGSRSWDWQSEWQLWIRRERGIQRKSARQEAAGSESEPKRATPVTAQQSMLWERARAKLRDSLGKATFRSWIVPLGFVSFAEGVLTLAAPEAFIAARVRAQHLGDIRDAFGNGVLAVTVVSPSNAATPATN
jgi:hypothetical protein